jgi:hypothetical protein
LGAGRGSPHLLLVIGFLVPFLVFTLVGGGELFDPFWWASPSLISAIVFAGWLLDRFARTGSVARSASFLFVVYLGAHFVPLALRPGGPGGAGYPRASVEALVQEAIGDAREHLNAGDLPAAKARLIYALNLGGRSPEVEALLQNVRDLEAKTTQPD